MENENHQKPCPKCGKGNSNNARFCNACGSSLSLTGLDVKTSGLAITVFICALCGLVLLVPVFISTLYPRSRLNSSEWTGFAFLSGVIVLGVTAILGLVSIIRIERSGGKVTGRGFAIGAFLVSIFGVLLFLVWPIIGPRKRSTAYRMVCGINLSDLGKAMLIYAGDYDEKWPTAGGPNSTWASRIPNWKADNRFEAYDMQQDGSGGWGSISSSLYLLVKYCELTPKQFICKGDSGITEFKPAEYGLNNKDLTNLWDFGPNPQSHCSYSYHIPFGEYRLTRASKPGMAVAADRNPWVDSPFVKSRDFRAFDPNGNSEQVRAGNAIVHKEDGQNVLFLDGHVSFEKNSFCGVNDDNIYTYWDGADVRRGIPPKLGSQPADGADSLLVNDPAIAR